MPTNRGWDSVFASVALVGLAFHAVGFAGQKPQPTANDGKQCARLALAEATPKPRVIPFSGTLRNALGQVAAASVTLTFSLYGFPEGGTPIWIETQTVQTDDEGRYTAWLGATSPQGLPPDVLSRGAALWLGVSPQSPRLAEQPRVLLAAVPYAVNPPDVDVQTKRKSAGTPLDIADPNVTTTGGTTNYIPLWTGTSTILNSGIYQSGSNIGVGTTNPLTPLDVHGQALTEGPTAGFQFNDRGGLSGSSQWYVKQNVSRLFRSDLAADVLGIGATSTSGTPLIPTLSTPFTMDFAGSLALQGPSPWIDVTTYGAVADAKISGELQGGTNCTVTGKTVTCGNPIFTGTDVNKSIEIPGAGPAQSAPLPPNETFYGTIASTCTSPCSTATATLTSAVNTNVTVPVPITWGTDNSAAFQAAWNAAPCRGGEVFVPSGGDYMFGSAVQTTDVPAPTAPSATAGSGTGGMIPASQNVTLAYTYVNRCGETAVARSATVLTGTGTNNFISFSAAPPGMGNATSYNLYACAAASPSTCPNASTNNLLTLQQANIALGVLPAQLNSVSTTGAQPPAANTTIQTGLVIQVQGGSAKWEGSSQSNSRFLTAIPIAIFQFGQGDANTLGGFQLWNAAFRDTSSNGSALGGVYAVNQSEAVVAFTDFENFNGQHSTGTDDLGLSYGIKWDTAGGIFNNDDLMIHDKGKNNSVIVDASAPLQDGPLVIGGDYFPALENASWAPATCYGFIGSGPLRISGGTHFDIDTGGNGVTGCVGVKVGVLNGTTYTGAVAAIGTKMESAELAHAGIGFEIGPSTANAPNEIDATFSDIATTVLFDLCQGSVCPGPTRIVESIVSPNGTAPYITDNSPGKAPYSYELYQGPVGTNSLDALSFSGSASFGPTNPGVVGLAVKGAASQSGDLLEFQNSGATVLARVSNGGNIVSNASYQFTNSGANAQMMEIQLRDAGTFLSGQLMCQDTSTDNDVVVCPTTNPGPVVGVSASAGTNAQVMLVVLGVTIGSVTTDGSCTRGNFLVRSMGTAGLATCTSTPTLGATVGISLQSRTGSGTVNAIIETR